MFYFSTSKAYKTNSCKVDLKFYRIKSAQRGKIIGTTTGVSTGNPIFIDLGFGLGCCICTKHELDMNRNEFIGIGIQLDIVAEEDINTFLNNGDSVIEKVLDFLRSK